MDGKRRTGTRNSILRAVFVALSLLFQVGWIVIQVLRLNEYSAWISLATGILCVIVVLQLYSKRTTAAMKMPWILLILLFPVMGLSLYLMIEVFGDLGNTEKRLTDIRGKMDQLEKPGEAMKELVAEDVSAANIFRYVEQFAGSPVHKGTSVCYYPEATDAFEALKRNLEQAKQFIFMEYFIVADGSAFRELRQILERKARQGVDVRLMYDDIGSIGYVNFSFVKELRSKGIRCQVFNPALPVLNLFMNHRDHRKITVIDGEVGFTGGFNLEDAYFDRIRPYGKWKDTGIRMEGPAVRNLTEQFLEMWYATERKEEDLSRYLLTPQKQTRQESGFVQPYGDDPLGKERITENVYLNLIFRARERLYIMTPYLIITEEMIRALGLAAKRGVDVRIVTPGIPDKKTVYRMTRSYYWDLADQGVRIYEYTPGFLHAKQCLCDGDMASIGTSNFDYRSLYLHFENNVLLYDDPAIARIAEDFEKLFPQCREVTQSYRFGKKGLLYTWQCLLRLFAPLM